VLFVWGEVSGQGHMDLIPWYWKLGLSAGLSFGVVQATASAAGVLIACGLWLVLAGLSQGS